MIFLFLMGLLKKYLPSIKPAGNIKTLNFKNLHVSAGWFDSSVSFGEPGYEERETINNGLTCGWQKWLYRYCS